MLRLLCYHIEGASRVLHAPDDTRSALAFQNRRLRQLVRHCYENVDYYKETFRRAGVHPGDIRGLEDLPKIPLASREEIQRLEPSKICSHGANPEKLLIRRTSGSSGIPLTIRRGWLEEQLLLTLRSRSVAAGGAWPIRQHKLQLVHLSTATEWKRKTYGKSWHARLGIFPKTVLDWQTPTCELIDRIAERRPDVIQGAPSILSWIADELTPEHRLRIPQQRLMRTGGEVCTAKMRQQIEEGFGAPLLEVYGSHEFVPLARRPPGQSSFRVCGNAVILEILKDGRHALPGEAGEVVGTALHSFAMPFLRYRLGDLVGRDGADNAHPYSVFRLSSIHGRVIDRFLLGAGNQVHPYNIANVFRDHAPWLRRFQIVQTARNSFWFRVVPYEPPSEESLQALTIRLEQAFPEPVSIRIDLVNELPPTATGKFYLYVCLERFERWGRRPEPVHPSEESPPA